MEATIDSAGRILVPKTLRAHLGITPGTKVNITPYGEGFQVIPGGRTATIVHTSDGHLAAKGSTPITDDMMFDLIDSGRK
ncbi:MAG: AbrB/MazE/SpoVT family DNA-binding domain-containing protein [Actinomycetaceae bacterium]|nr:AbrB/MazE/SpoVT family DNA-binding domain-containing protein [Actinomycetaceae bacterium]